MSKGQARSGFRSERSLPARPCFEKGSRSRAIPTSTAIILLLAVIWIVSQVQRLGIPLFIGASSFMADFGITAATAGLIASIYFPFYGLMQIPSGVLADQMSPRRNIVVGGAIAGLGSVAVYLAPTVEVAIAGRVVSGIAAGVLWLSMLKIIAGLPGVAYSRGLSTLAAMSNFGTVCILVGIPWLLSAVHWRPLGVAAVLVSFVLLLALARTPLPARPVRETTENHSWKGLVAKLTESRVALSRVLVGWRNWQLYLPTMMWNGANLALPAWLPRYGRDALGLPPAETGILPALTPLGVVLGSFLLARLAHHRLRPDVRWYYGAASIYAVLLTFLASGALATPGTVALHGLVFAMGLLYSCYFVGMAHVGELTDRRYLGTATGIFNGIGFFPAFAFPWLMGLLMDAIDRPIHADWTYSAGAYHAGFSLMAVGLIASLAASAAIGWGLRWRLATRQHATRS